MSWMDFKTAQALKAQKLSSASLRTQNGVQKGTGDAGHVGVESMSVQKAISQEAPKASRRVQGVSKEARMTFAPGRGQRLAVSKADTGTHRHTMVPAPDHILNVPKPQAKPASYADASYGPDKSCDAPPGSVSSATSQFAKMRVAERAPAAPPASHAEESYADESYAEEAYSQEYYDESEAHAGEEYYEEEAYSELHPEESYYEEGHAEEAYAEEGYAEEGYAEEGYYEEEGYAEEGYYEEGYAEEGYYEEGYAEEGYTEEAYYE